MPTGKKTIIAVDIVVVLWHEIIFETAEKKHIIEFIFLSRREKVQRENFCAVVRRLQL